MSNKYTDGTDILKDVKKLGLEFFHVASGHSVSFKAFLTSYDDKFKSDWSSEKVYGRMDPIHTFQGTERTISLAWDVPSADFPEAELNFSNASMMYSMLYPAFRPDANSTDKNTGVMSAPPLVKLKFGNLIYDAGADYNGPAEDSGLLGWIADLSFAPDLEAGFFDEKPNFLIPQTIKLSCTFNVLHTHALGWDLAKKKQKTGKGGGSSTAVRPLRKEKQNFPYDLDVAPGSDPSPTARIGKDSKVPTTGPYIDPELEEQAKRSKQEKLKKDEISKSSTKSILES